MTKFKEFTAKANWYCCLVLRKKGNDLFDQKLLSASTKKEDSLVNLGSTNVKKKKLTQDQIHLTTPQVEL